MYDHTLHCKIKYFCGNCLQAFSTKALLKCNFNDCLKINAKQKNKMAKQEEYVKLKNCERKIKLPFI